jgi:LEA14-like dessication related protein
MQLGCSATPRGVATPHITVQNVLALSSGTPQRFRVSMLIDNPNTEPLSIKQFEFKLRLANEGILDGRSFAPVTVPALDRQTITLELSSDIISSLSRLMAFVQGAENTLPYEIYGNLTLDRTFQNTLFFSGNGRVPLMMTDQR